MGKRLKFRCWNCKKKYTLHRELEEGQVLRVACPYCHKEGVVELEPYRKKITPIFSGETNGRSETDGEYELVLPEVLPTRPPQ